MQVHGECAYFNTPSHSTFDCTFRTISEVFSISPVLFPLLVDQPAYPLLESNCEYHTVVDLFSDVMIFDIYVLGSSMKLWIFWPWR